MDLASCILFLLGECLTVGCLAREMGGQCPSCHRAQELWQYINLLLAALLTARPWLAYHVVSWTTRV
jgi:hypothetical protein